MKGAVGVALVSGGDVASVLQEGWVREYKPEKPLTLYVIGDLDGKTKAMITMAEAQARIEGIQAKVKVTNHRGVAKVVNGFEWTMWRETGTKDWEQEVVIDLSAGDAKVLVHTTFAEEHMKREDWNELEKRYTKGHKEYQRRINEARTKGEGKGKPAARADTYGESKRLANTYVNASLGESGGDGVDMYSLWLNEDKGKGRRWITAKTKATQAQWEKLKEISGQGGEFFEKAADPQERQWRETHEAAIVYPEDTKLEEALKGAHSIRSSYLKMTREGRMMLVVPKESEDEASRMIRGRPRRKAMPWEIDGIPVVVQQEELIKGITKQAGWEIEVERAGWGKTYMRERRVYRKVKVWSDHEPPARYLKIRGVTITINPLKTQWQREQELREREEEARKPKKFAELFKEEKAKGRNDDRRQGEEQIAEIMRRRREEAKERDEKREGRNGLAPKQTRILGRRQDADPGNPSERPQEGEALSKQRKVNEQEAWRQSAVGRHTIPTSEEAEARLSERMEKMEEGLQGFMKEVMKYMEQMRWEISQERSTRSQEIGKAVQEAVNQGWGDQD